MTTTGLKWKLYNLKLKALVKLGFMNNFIKEYDENFIANLRRYSYSDIPLSIYLLSANLCTGRCYQRAIFASFGMLDEKFRIIEADVDILRLNPAHIEDYKNGLLERETMLLTAL